MEKFQNKFRIPSARFKNWDYRNLGYYFITICTYKHEHYFGNIKNGKMLLSGAGIVADILWHELKHHFKHIEIDAFVVMPNHIHGILILKNEIGSEQKLPAEASLSHVETLHATSLQKTSLQKNEFMSSISPKSGSISTIIRSYKSSVTKHCNRLGLSFKWQTRFHDHVIRNEEEYLKISDYVINNPQKWLDDIYH